MKPSSLFLFLSLFFCLVPGFSVHAQRGKTGANPLVKKTTAKPIFLKTLHDSASYAIGLSIAGFCKQHGIIHPDKTLIAQSFDDVANNKDFLIPEVTCNDIVNRLLIQGETNHKDSVQLTIPDVDSVSYAIGINHASFFKQQGIGHLDTTYIIKAVTTVLTKQKTLFNDQVANKVMNKLIIRVQEEKAGSIIREGRAFLANNKKRPGVKVTTTGLQYEILRQGKGMRPAKIDTFVCQYRGTLVDGTEFDASYNRNQPLVMGVSQVIRGWTEGLQLMPVGSKYRFYVPYELGYGPFDNPPIPGGSALIFEIELLNVIKARPAKKK